jgi:hypothetical protein
LGGCSRSICDDIIIELIVVAAVMIAFVLFVRW